MQKRIALFVQATAVLVALVLSLWIASSVHARQLENQQALLEDFGTLSEAPSASLQTLQRGPVEDENAYHSLTLTVDNRPVTYYLPKERFISTYVSILPITAVVVGVLVLLGHLLSGWFTRAALRPVIHTMEEIKGILSGVATKPAGKSYPELEPYIRDIEFEKAQITESMNKLIESEKMRRDFTANVSHELKTPLTSINGYAEMITSGLATEEDTRRFAKVILSEGNRLLGLIDDTIRLSLLENENPAELLRDELDLQALAQEIVRKHSINAEKRGVRLTANGQKAMILGNRRMMEDAIMNLVSNAVKYNKENGKVQVQTFTDRERSYLVVKDTGIGISEEDQQRIFERFYMSNRARANKTGTGLGLSIVKHVVKLHKGEIDLRSDLGKGTSIKIAFRKLRI